MVRISNKSREHEMRMADTWISGFFSKNSKIQEPGKGGIQVVHRKSQEVRAPGLGNELKGLHAGPLQLAPTAMATLKGKWHSRNSDST